MNSANVITVLHNNISTLQSFLTGLEAQRESISQVVLVDNASTDDTLRKTRELAQGSALNITVVVNSNNGFAGGYARGGLEILNPSLPTLCLNPDVELEPYALGRMLRVLNEGDHVGIVTAPLITDTGEADSASRRPAVPSRGQMTWYISM